MGERDVIGTVTSLSLLQYGESEVHGAGKVCVSSSPVHGGIEKSVSLQPEALVKLVELWALLLLLALMLKESVFLLFCYRGQWKSRCHFFFGGR